MVGSVGLTLHVRTYINVLYLHLRAYIRFYTYVPTPTYLHLRTCTYVPTLSLTYMILYLHLRTTYAHGYNHSTDWV